MLRMADEIQLVVGVAGRIGSGKSEIAHFLENRYRFQYLRYSLVLSEWFKTDPLAKNLLQEVGWNVMSGEGQRELNTRLIAGITRGRDCAVDGLRHPIDFDSLKTAFPSGFFLVYVDTPADIRFERLRHRYRRYEDFLAADSHPVESNIDSLRPFALAELSGSLPIEQLGAQIHKLILAFRSGRAS